MSYISVCNWRRFQHYDPAKRQPPWIKNYTDLMRDDDYLALTARQRGILHGIWLLYAETRSKLGSSPARLGRLIGDDSVRARDLDVLNHAGFIDIVDSAEQAEGYREARPHARPRTRGETETEEEKEQELLDPERNGSMERGRSRFEIPTSVSEALLRDAS